MMSLFNELENWDPMAEDYSCPKFNSYNNNNSFSQHDDCSLYLKNIPSSLSQDAFLALMSENGRKVKRHKLYPARLGMDKTTGLVSFGSSKDAQEVINLLNNKPPMNLIINYALMNKKKEVSNKEILQDCNSSTSYPQKNLLSSESVGLIPRPLIMGKGRGSSCDSRSFPSLKVVLDGKKRVAYHAHKQPTKIQENLDVPKLINNPFLSCSCGSIGTFSCGICKTPYCSKNCQVEDWPNHKSSCKPFTKTQMTNEDSSVRKTSHDSSYVSDSSGSDTDRKLTTSSPVLANNFISKKSMSEITHNFVKVSQLVKVDDIKSCVLPPDKQSQVKICHIQSPSLFWVHMKSSEKIISQIEKETYLPAVKPPICYEINNICCFIEDGILRRVNVLKNNQDGTSSVQLMDYGKTSIIQSKDLFPLPDNLKQLPYQAICCKLVDTFEDKEAVWNEEDTIVFQMYSTESYYTARVIRCENKIYEVNLTNEEGISLYSIIAGLKHLNLSSVEVSINKVNKSCGEFAKIEKEEKINHKNDLKSSIPSVWTNIKSGAEVTILAVEFEEDKFWGILDDGSGAPDDLKQLDVLLQNLNTKEVNLYCEEGDVVAGFSNNFKQFYRCVVLKRMRDDFLVHFIDFGNKEKVDKLCELTPDLLNKCCYVVCCKKPNFLSAEEFKKIFLDVKTVSAKKSNQIVELLFIHNNITISVACFPWYHGLSLKSVPHQTKSYASQKLNEVPSTSFATQKLKEVPSTIIASQKVKEVPSTSIAFQKLNEIPSKSELSITSVKKITSDLIGIQNIAPGNKYKVKVAFIIDVSKVYVQLSSLGKDLDLLSEQLNKYCASTKTIDYSPMKNEIVCCKFAADGYWYRGQVIGKRGKTYRVFFIDFGNEDMVCSTNLLPLPEKFAVAKFGICVSLSNLKNEDLSEQILLKLTSETWEMEVLNSSICSPDVLLFQDNKSLIDFISKTRSHTKVLKVPEKKLPHKECLKKSVFASGTNEILLCHIEKETFFCQLIADAQKSSAMFEELQSTSKKKPVLGELCVGCLVCAKSTDGHWYRGAVDTICGDNSYDISFIDFGNCETIPADSVMFLSEEFMKYPIFCIPFKISNYKHAQKYAIVNNILSIKTIDSPTKEIPLVELIFPENKDLPNILSLEKKLLPLDKVQDIEICHTDGDIFYAQMTSDKEQIRSLESKLQCSDEYTAAASDLLEIGTVVCAKFTDSTWYRGSVENMHENVCNICFFDYGNVAEIQICDIRILPSELSSFPIFSIPVKFKNLEILLTQIEMGNTSFSVRTLKLSEDGIHLVEVVMPEQHNPVTSINHQLLSDLPIQVTVCYQDNDIYYIKKVSDSQKLEEMMLNLQKQESLKAITHIPKDGEFLCVKQAGLWHRCLVKRNCGDVCKVFFIDCGNTSDVNIKHMCYLPSVAAFLPMFCIPIKLSDSSQITTQLSIHKQYVVKRVGSSCDNVQLVKVRPSFAPICLSSMKISTLKDNTTSVYFQSFDEKFYYVTKADDQSKIVEMNELLSNFEGESIIESPVIGEVLVVKSTNNKFYRGYVTQHNSQTCKVFLIDTGRTEDVASSEMYYMPIQLSLYSVFSIKVSLNSSKPLKKSIIFGENYIISKTDDVPTVEIYPQYAISMLKREYLPLKETRNVIFFHMDQDVFYLQDLLNSSRIAELQGIIQSHCSSSKCISHQPSVGDLLIGQSSIDSAWYRGCVEEIISSDTYKIKFVDYGNTEIICASKLQCFKEEFIDYPVFCTNVKINNVSPNLQLEEIYTVVAESLPVNDEVQVVSFMPKPESQQPSSNLIEENTVIKEDSAKYFYTDCNHVPFPPGQQDVIIYSVIEDDLLAFCAPYNKENLTATMELTKSITEYCKNLNVSSYNGNGSPQVGEMVLAKFEDEWYRATVVEDTDAPFYGLLYVDFGNTEKVSLESLRQMTRQFMVLDIQAHPCHLTGFQFEKENLQVIIDELKQCTYKCLEGTVSIIENDGDIHLCINQIVEHLAKKNLISS